MNIKFNKDNLIPKQDIVVEALLAGLLTTLIFFLIDFFGFNISFIPKGFEVFAVVMVAIYVKHLIIIRIGGKVFM